VSTAQRPGSKRELGTPKHSIQPGALCRRQTGWPLTQTCQCVDYSLPQTVDHFEGRECLPCSFGTAPRVETHAGDPQALDSTRGAVQKTHRVAISTFTYWPITQTSQCVDYSLSQTADHCHARECLACSCCTAPRVKTRAGDPQALDSTRGAVQRTHRVAISTFTYWPLTQTNQCVDYSLSQTADHCHARECLACSFCTAPRVKTRAGDPQALDSTRGAVQKTHRVAISTFTYWPLTQTSQCVDYSLSQTVDHFEGRECLPCSFGTAPGLKRVLGTLKHSIQPGALCRRHTGWPYLLSHIGLSHRPASA
jgi:hypothetical protein